MLVRLIVVATPANPTTDTAIKTANAKRHILPELSYLIARSLGCTRMKQASSGALGLLSRQTRDTSPSLPRNPKVRQQAKRGLSDFII